ncbi:MAG TPA: SDR family NAD(P)-dependent oxidoreductase, partial [Herpetosiphonaceae bacterium]
LFAERARRPWRTVALISNAAVLTPIAPVRALADEAIQRSLDINVGGGLRLISAFVRAFQDHPARKLVANISSGAARKAYQGWSLYCAAKACTEQFVRALALEQAGEAHPLLCVNINPGLIDSEMQAEIRRVTAAEFPDIERFVGYQESGQLRAPAAVAAEIRRILAGALEQGATYAVEL